MNNFVFFVLFSCFGFSFTEGQTDDEGGGNVTDACLHCQGEGYECIRGRCYCADGFIPTLLQTSCIKCPGLGERCRGRCCSGDNLQCWQGVCQYCYDSDGAWLCTDGIDQIVLVSVTQIAMATALVLGIIATFVLLYKLCAVSSIRSVGNPFDTGRLSVGSIQLYIDERLRDAPPRYSRATPTPIITPSPDEPISPGPYFINAGFVHDSSVPPPPYSEKIEDDNHVASHV